MNKRHFLCILLAAMATVIHATVRLSHLVGDNMVVQQQSHVRLWGWARARGTVTVTTSWDSQRVTVTADAQGRFLATVATPAASFTPLAITFSDADGDLTISNVLAGEVWVCAGQSNMEMPVKGFGNCPVEGYNHEVTDARHYPHIRSVKVPSVMSATPLDDADCQWRVCTPQSVGDFSATGYFFAKTLSQALHTPVGLIEANKGGTRVESWLTKENLQRYTDDPTDSVAICRRWPQWDYHRSLLWGNGTFHPIVHATVKGILFYQGCSNVGDPGNQYSQRLQLLVDQWRSQFQLGQLPFYFVQIAPYASGDPQGTWNALLQEQQFVASQLIPNSALVCTNDCVYPYESTQIHPTQKRKVGQRLAYLALNKTYGMDRIICQSPSYKDMKITGDTILLHFNDLSGAISRFEDISGFEIAGADRVFHPATARHFWQPGGGYWDECLAVTSPQVSAPVAVRYCFRNWQLGNLANAGALPLFPFRTDRW